MVRPIRKRIEYVGALYHEGDQRQSGNYARPAPFFMWSVAEQNVHVNLP